MTKHFRDDADWVYPSLDTVLNRALLRSSKVVDEGAVSKCAQCKKEFKYGKSTVGCPKCAPNVDIPESEFKKPINDEAGVWVWEQFGIAFEGSGYIWHERVGYGKPNTDSVHVRNARKVPYV